MSTQDPYNQPNSSQPNPPQPHSAQPSVPPQVTPGYTPPEQANGASAGSPYPYTQGDPHDINDFDDAKNMSAPFFSSLFDFSFSQFITIRFASFIYACVLVLIVLGYLVGVIAAFSQGAGPGFGALILGLPVALLYVIGARLGLEFTVAMIRTAQNTSIIAQKR